MASSKLDVESASPLQSDDAVLLRSGKTEAIALEANDFSPASSPDPVSSSSSVNITVKHAVNHDGLWFGSRGSTGEFSLEQFCFHWCNSVENLFYLNCTNGTKD